MRLSPNVWSSFSVLVCAEQTNEDWTAFTRTCYDILQEPILTWLCVAMSPCYGAVLSHECSLYQNNIHSWFMIRMNDLRLCFSSISTVRPFILSRRRIKGYHGEIHWHDKCHSAIICIALSLDVLLCHTFFGQTLQLKNGFDDDRLVTSD